MGCVACRFEGRNFVEHAVIVKKSGDVEDMLRFDPFAIMSEMPLIV